MLTKKGISLKEEPPFPFIVGAPRSGTTLLRVMLASHPELAIPNEAYFRIRMSLQHLRYETPDGVDFNSFFSDLLGDSHWWRLPMEGELRAAVRDASPRTFAEAMREVFRFAARLEGKPRYGDKTPQGLLVMWQLAQIFPEARFIHIIRDGRDVALSHTSTVSFIPTVGEAAIMWSEYIRRGRNDGVRLGPKRYHEVRYERLIDDPEPVLRSVCDFVELEFDPAMLRYFENPMERLGYTQRDLIFHKSLYKPPTKGIRDWRRQMPRAHLEIFEAIAGDILGNLGYERAIAHIRLRARVRAELARLYVGAKQAAKKGFGKTRWWPVIRRMQHQLLRRR